MKKLVVALAALALSAPAFAQSANGGQIGLGVSVTPLTPWATSVWGGPVSPAVEVYLPIQVAPNFRIEPSVGIFSADFPDTSPNADRRDFTIGVGGFVTQKTAPSAEVYAGGRLKLNFADNHPGESGTDFILAAAAGGEYFLAPKFSIGAEAQLGFYSNSSASGDAQGFFTNGLGFFRFYF